MTCPYCQGDATQEVDRTTAWGYQLFRCRPCRRTFNERTGTPFNRICQNSEYSSANQNWRGPKRRFTLKIETSVAVGLVRSEGE